MITLVFIPKHFRHADIKDIERELIGLILSELKMAIEKRPYGFSDFMKGFSANAESTSIVEINEVRTHCYHSPNKPGWTALNRAKFGNRKHCGLEVKWTPHVLVGHNA